MFFQCLWFPKLTGFLCCLLNSKSEFLQISKEHGGIMRFIQVSCLGASPSSPSRMLRAKAAAEEAVLRELPEVYLVFFFTV